MNKIVVSLLAGAVLMLGSSAFAQSQKIGYVNSAKIFQELPEAKEAQKKLDALVKPIQAEIETRQKQLQAKYEEYQKKETMMNDAAKKAAQQELIELEQKYNLYRQEKLGNDGEIAQQQEKILEPIKEKIIKGIERVAKDEKYSLVFDKTETVQVLLYGDAAHDLTFKVLDRLKRTGN